MSLIHTYPVPRDIAQHAFISEEMYREMYRASVDNPDAFWREQGQIISWITPYTRVKNSSFDPGHINIRWFEDGTLNLAAQLLGSSLGGAGAIRPPSSGRGMTHRKVAMSRIASYTRKCVVSPTYSSHSRWQRAMSSRSICRWWSKRLSRCWPVRVSVRSIR
ncbi:Acetyl-coenzyme A synthetase [Edwardsiella tarda]|nr:Acetyl-coenzyme A synthetase [Edwardsiella tarda]